MNQPTMNKSFLTIICKSKRAWLFLSVMVIVIATVAIGTFAYLNKLSGGVENNFAFRGYTYTLTYDANGGADAPTEQTAIDVAKSYNFTVSSSVPTKDKWVFVGWADTPTATIPQYKSGSTITLLNTSLTKTLYAVWAQDSTLKTGTEINKAIKGTADYNVVDTTVKSVVFGNTADYAETIKGTAGVTVDENETGTIKMYRVKNGSTYNVYILSYGGIYANKDASYMLYNCKGATTVDLSNFKTDNVTNMSNMFYYCEKVTTLDVTKFDTTNVTDMSGMFYFCEKVTTLDVTKFDTTNVTDMSGMFYCCRKITTLDVTKFDTTNVTNMKYMFCGLNNITSLDLSKLNTENVTNMSGMLGSCINVTDFDLSNFNTKNVTDMSSMLSSCASLNSLNLSSFDTTNVTDMSFMFRGTPLKVLDISNFNTKNVTNIRAMFAKLNDNENNLATIYVGVGWNVDNVENDNSMFYKCEKLVGGKGTKFDKSYIDKRYAHDDGGPSNPGYLTLK